VTERLKRCYLHPTGLVGGPAYGVLQAELCESEEGRRIGHSRGDK